MHRDSVNLLSQESSCVSAYQGFLLFSMPYVAHADSLTVYNVHGSLQSGGSTSGTISVSPSGNVTNVAITVTDMGATHQFGGVQASASKSKSRGEVQRWQGKQYAGLPVLLFPTE